jgi:hypothetical protein
LKLIITEILAGGGGPERKYDEKIIVCWVWVRAGFRAFP